MMTIGQRLGGYVRQRALKQMAVATDWLERWQRRGEKGPPWSAATIDAQLGRLLDDQGPGIRFFFQDMVRGKLLLQALQVPEAEWTELFQLAGSALHREGALAKVLIDVTGFGPVGVASASTLFTELKRLLVLEGPYPIDLVLLEEQYDRLPRGFDPLLSRERDRVRAVQVKTPEQGWQVTCERAEDQGLVISARRYPVFERWIAADFDGTSLQLEPIRGMDWLRQKGTLPSLPPVTHDLARLVPPGAEKGVGIRRYSACEQHRWLHVLSSEEASARSGADAATRMGLARLLGITATSTPGERLDAEVEALRRELPAPMKLQTASAEDLRGHHQRARRRKLEPTAIRVADTVYLLNVPDAARLAQSRPWVSVHEIEPEPTALGLLLAEVDRWSELDFLLDPFLEHLIQRLDPEEKKRTAFLHARAGLLLNRALRPHTPEPETDWKPLLAELLAHDPPEAELRVSLGQDSLTYAHQKRPVFLLPRDQWEPHEKLPLTPLRHVPPQGDVLLHRRDQSRLVTHSRDADSGEPPGVLLAREADTARDPEFWLKAHEASARSDVQSTYAQNTHVYLGTFGAWVASALEIAPAYWEAADRELALAWLALRTALVNPSSIRLPGGGVLLRLAGAFFAEVRITRRARPASTSQVRGCLLLEPPLRALRHWNGPERYVMTDEAFRISELVATHTVTSGQDFGARLPRRIHLLGERVCADIRFRGSALFGEATPGAAALARISDDGRPQDDD